MSEWVIDNIHVSKNAEQQKVIFFYETFPLNHVLLQSHTFIFILIFREGIRLENKNKKLFWQINIFFLLLRSSFI